MVEQFSAQPKQAKNFLNCNSKSLKHQKIILSENRQLTCTTNYLSLLIESL